MILGIGSDIADIARLEKTLARFGDRFLQRVFTPQEIAKAESRTAERGQRAGTLAKRFAAKEACFKALGVKGVFWQDMEVVSLPSGKPALRLSGGAQMALTALVPPGMRAQIDLTMSDAYPHALAVVVISAVPDVS